MTSMKVFGVALLAVWFAAILPAQQDEGIMPRWEVASIAQDLGVQVDQVEQILGGVHPEEWAQAGVAYAGQRETLLTELGYLRNSAAAMARRPESLPIVVDTFLWIDRTNSMLISITDGVRRYQNAAVADLLESSRGQYSGAAEKLKEYMRQLAISVNLQMEIAHEEAQRCRTELLTQPR